MRKRKLKVEEIEVTSYETGAAAGESRGTVRAMGNIPVVDPEPASDGCTMYGWSCVDPWQTCYMTCLGYHQVCQ